MNAPAALPKKRRHKGDLVRDEEILRVLKLVAEAGLPIGAVDIRADGVTIHPPQPQPGNAFDNWKRENAGDPRNPSRS